MDLTKLTDKINDRAKHGTFGGDHDSSTADTLIGVLQEWDKLYEIKRIKWIESPAIIVSLGRKPETWEEIYQFALNILELNPDEFTDYSKGSTYYTIYMWWD